MGANASPLVGDLDLVPFDQRNTLWLAFTSPTMRAALPDWDEAVRRMVGQYRAAMADHVVEPAWKCLIKRLQEAAPEFAAMWQRHDIAAPENLTKRFSHPQLGALRFGYTNLWLAQRIGVRLVTYTPADEHTTIAIGQADDTSPRSIVLGR